MKISRNPGLTFDDVLLIPQKSTIRSRTLVDTTSELVCGIKLAIPIISANMDTVTETTMAIAMAQAGGIGMIHRFMTIDKQVEMVNRVKRAESFIVENPIMIPQDATIQEAYNRMQESGIGGLVITDQEKHLLGLVTTRDILLTTKYNDCVASVMKPRQHLIVASAGESLETARLTLHKHRIEKLPLVDENDRVVGLITAQDIKKIQEHPQATKDAKGRLRVGAAIGVRTPDFERAHACIKAGADILLIDVAHGHSEHVYSMVRQLKNDYPDTPIIAGNVATEEGVSYLVEAGADAVKVGVGSGSICTTRLVTGFGVPQLTAIADCAKIAHRLNTKIIADGGIRNSGDLTKAFAAGADTVMIGSLFAGTEESPGPAVMRNGRRYKVVRGMASLSANIYRKEIEKQGEIDPDEWESIVPEGVEALVPYQGEINDILYQLIGGLRSGMSYAGANNLAELSINAKFIIISQAGKIESGPHDIELL